MTPNPERLRRELLAARYLEAVETDDFAAQSELWKQAETEPELVNLFREVHEDLIAEQEEADGATLQNHLENAVEKHLPSATIVRESTGPVTFADVADELFRDPPGQLPPEAYRLNGSLRQSTEPLPKDLGLSKLIAFAEAKFGPAPRDYWKAFREVAIKLEIRQAAETEYQLAARKAPKPEGGK